ncbi:DUF4389 domain-containing protein [Cellvibrio mixtus]|uniref:DUF4389 domain-containing protein n=1 Tax=Cellvibrio mixtus TaxID=39650 RepID=UPI000587AF7D|nr:DUF4389 domain-containing protein [Cellvibrio mixtus]
MDNEQLKSNLTSGKHWLRLVFMLLFAAVLQLASLVMWVIVAVQFLFSLITGEDNQHLRRFGHSLSTYIYDVLKFLCYSSEEKPFPFADWPVSNPEPVDAPEAAAPAVLSDNNAPEKATE